MKTQPKLSRNIMVEIRFYSYATIGAELDGNKLLVEYAYTQPGLVPIKKPIDKVLPGFT